MCLNEGPECPTPYAGEGSARNVPVAALICVFSYCASGLLLGHRAGVRTHPGTEVLSSRVLLNVG